MQTANVNLPITVTGRHVEVTESMREHAQKKVEGLHLDYPRIIEAKVILDVRGRNRQHAEILLFCANHIHIEASTETEDMYKSIDETISKIARRMRKFKTRLLKSHRPRPDETIKHLNEHVYKPEASEEEPTNENDVIPHIVHQENYRVRPLYTDEAIMEMELSERNFIVFRNAKTEKLSILYRRGDGDYGLIEP